MLTLVFLMILKPNIFYGKKLWGNIRQLGEISCKNCPVKSQWYVICKQIAQLLTRYDTELSDSYLLCFIICVHYEYV